MDLFLMGPGLELTKGGENMNTDELRLLAKGINYPNGRIFIRLENTQDERYTIHFGNGSGTERKMLSLSGETFNADQTEGFLLGLICEHGIKR